jgi:MFS family permease
VTALPGALTGYLARIPAVLGLVLGNPPLRRVMASYSCFIALEWGGWIAIMVFAYSQGGATTAGLVAFAQLVPALLISPLGAVLGDRHRPGRVLALAYLLCGLTELATAAALLAGAAPLVVYALAAGAATSASLVRPPLYALVPTLARTPYELTAANVTTGWVESMTVLVAPAVTGVLMGASGPGLALAVLGLLGLVAFAVVLGAPGPPPTAGTGEASVLEHLTEGVQMLRREREPRMLIVLLGALFVGIGALDVLYAQLALGALDAGAAWAGYLNAAFGLGGAIGIGATVALVGRRRLLAPIVAAIGLWAGSLVLLALTPTKPSAVVLLASAGVAWTLVDVGGRTLLQRASPGDLVARVFGMLEGVQNAGLAVGSLLVPALVALGGTTAALVGAAAILPVALGLTIRRLRTIDRTATVPIVQIGLLRSMPLFASLSAPTLESIARRLEQVDVPAGAVVLRQGDEGDRWYAVADGRLRVERDGEVLAELQRGAGFGEIALLREVPRTATVTCLSDCVLYALDKEPFLEAVTGHLQVSAEAERVVDAHLATHDQRSEPQQTDA